MTKSANAKSWALSPSSYLGRLYSRPSVVPSLLLFENFDSYTIPGPLNLSVGSGATISIESAGSYSGSALKATYPQQTGSNGAYYVYSGKNVYQASADGSSEVYVRFRAKMPSAVKHGCKFVKVFGTNTGGTNYANCTFGLDYTGVDNGGMVSVSYGDGSSITNDAGNIINLSGTGHAIGRSSGTAVVSCPQGTRFASTDWGTGWHLFEFYVRFNSGTTAGNEVADGAFTVRIDGKTYVQATGLFNRHYSNLEIDRVEILGWMQGVSAGPCEIWFDNLEITRNGWGVQT